MSRWFRFYDDVINDPKVLKLPEGIRWAWVATLCIASKNDGMLPPIEDVAFLLRVTVKKASAIISALVAAGLLDKTVSGFAPHNWGGRQFLSDSSAERVRRHREKREAAGLQSQWTAPKSLRKEVYERDNFECVYCGSAEDLTLDHKTPEARGGTHDVENLQACCRKCNASKRDLTHDEYVTRNGLVTLLKRPQTTETEDRTEKKKETREGALVVDDGWPQDFREQFWTRFPNKVGKPKALGKLDASRKRGVAFADIMNGLDRYIASKPPDRAWLNPETFLNQERWSDQPALVTAGSSNGRRTVHEAANDLIAKISAFDQPAPGGLRGGEGEDAIRLLPSGRRQ